MPRKEEENQIINLPVAKKELTKEEIEKRNQTILNTIDKNRKDGLEYLEKKVDGFSNRSMISLTNPLDENILRDVEGCIRAIFSTVESMNAIIELLRRDFVNMVQNLESIAVSNWKSSSHLQVALSLLRDKGILSDEEMKQRWDDMIVPQIRQQQMENEKK